MSQFSLVTVIFASLIGLTQFVMMGDSNQGAEKPKIQIQEKKKILIPADDDKSAERRDFMRSKLQSSQFILEGLTLEDFKLIEKGIRQVKDITEGEGWVTIDDKRYQELTGDFKEALSHLESAVKSKNIDAVALRYYQMTTNCIDCHKHIREADYEL